MLTPLILLIVLMVVTAFIAHWSDNLGKKLGKKRLSLFGLRPRNTATLLTVVSSWAIMLITLAFLLLVFAPLRNALFRYDKERANNQQLQASTKNLRDQTRRLAQRVTDAREQLSSARVGLGQAQTQLDTARKNAFEARTNLAKSQNLAEHAEAARRLAQTREKTALQGAKQATAREQTARARENAARSSEGKARASLQLVSSNLQSTQVRLGQIQQRLQATDFKFAQANQRVQKAQQQLIVVNQNLKIAQKNADEANATARAAGQSAFKSGREALAAYRQADEARLQVTQAQSEVEQLRSQRQSLQSDIYELSRYAEGLSQEATLLASGDVRVSINQTLAENVVKKGDSESEIEATLRATLSDGQRILPKVLPGVTLNLLPLPIRAGDKDAYLVGDAIFSELARFIASRDEDVAVRLLATRNFSSRESTISGRFVVIPIHLVFAANRMLAETTIDGKTSDARIFNALLQVVEDGRAIAVKAGNTPPQSLEVPNFFAPDTNERIFEALHRIQAVGGPARVQMIVAADTTTIQSVRVRFEVEAAPRRGV